MYLSTFSLFISPPPVCHFCWSMSLRSVCIFFRFSAIAFDAQIRDDVCFSVVCPRFIYQTDAMEMVFDSQNYYTKANILSLSHSVYLVSTHFGFGSLTMQRRLYVCVRRRQGQKWHYHFIYRPKVIHNWNVSISSCFFLFEGKRNANNI